MVIWGCDAVADVGLRGALGRGGARGVRLRGVGEGVAVMWRRFWLRFPMQGESGDGDGVELSRRQRRALLRNKGRRRAGRRQPKALRLPDFVRRVTHGVAVWRPEEVCARFGLRWAEVGADDGATVWGVEDFAAQVASGVRLVVGRVGVAGTEWRAEGDLAAEGGGARSVGVVGEGAGFCAGGMASETEWRAEGALAGKDDEGGGDDSGGNGVAGGD